MYRVELKEQVSFILSYLQGVPNVPCGVESLSFDHVVFYLYQDMMFLMYRVELKVP